MVKTHKYTYGWCVVCREWKHVDELVNVRKGFRWKGEIAFTICRGCRDDLRNRYEAKRQVVRKTRKR